VYSGAAAVGTRKGVFKVADFLVAHDRLGHRSGQSLRYLLLSVWLVFLGRQGGYGGLSVWSGGRKKGGKRT
jgi:hypothetical protein